MFGSIFKKDENNQQQTPQAGAANAPQTDAPVPAQNTTAPVSQDTSVPAQQPSNQSAFYSQTPSGDSSQPPANASSDQMADIPSGTSADPGTNLETPTPQTPDAAAQTDQANPPQDGTSQVPPEAGQGGDMAALSHLDPRTAQALTHAQEETRRIKQQNIEPEQLLLGLLYDQQVYSMLQEQGADGGQISKEIQTEENMGTYQGQPTLSKISLEVFDQAYRDAKMRGSNFVSPEDVLIVLFSPNYKTAQYLQKHNLKKETMVEKFSKSPNTAYGKRTVLEKYGIDLTEEARAGKLDPIAGRDKEIDRMIHVLLRRTKNNPIIIGEPGVGKTA